MNVQVYANRQLMGRAAADWVQQKISFLLEQRQEVNMIFAAAPSQNEFLEALRHCSIDWHSVNAFHMDEYIGLTKKAPQGFGNFLKTRLFNQLKFKSVHYIDGCAEDLSEACAYYSSLLNTYAPDIVCMGIGENGHVAFNDPPVADFKDPALVKVVELDNICRNQQVNDGCFNDLGEVPTHAITLTIPALMRAPYISCVVPGTLKADAVYRTMHTTINESCPSTILRTKENAVMFCDLDSSSLLKINELGAFI